MATVNIFISKQPNGNGLYLTDSEGHHGNNNITTLVDPGDTVIWQLKPGGGIDAITAITPKQNNQDIFENPPAPVNSSDPASNWKGIVKQTVTGTESYTIGYKIGDQTLEDDPELDIKHGGG